MRQVNAQVFRRTAVMVAFLQGLSVPGVLLMSACDGNEARVRVRYVEAPTLRRELLSVTIDDGSGLRTMRAEDIGDNANAGLALSTAQSGTLRVRFRFAQGQGVVSEGDVSVTLHSDWEYGFSISVDSINPATRCFGCSGSRAFPLAPAYRRVVQDSVWMTWGGNSIKHPVTY